MPSPGIMQLLGSTILSSPTELAFPTNFATTTIQAGGGALSVSWPAGHAVDDVMFLAVVTNGQAMTTPTGCALINTPIGGGIPASAGGTRLYFYWIRATSTAMPALAIADSGNIQIARGVVLRGVRNTNLPYEAVFEDRAVPSAANWNFYSDQYPIGPFRRILTVWAMGRDSVVNTGLTSHTCAALANITEIMDNADSTSFGGTLAMTIAEIETVRTSEIGTNNFTMDGIYPFELCQIAVCPRHVSGQTDYYDFRSTDTFTAPAAGVATFHAIGGGAGSRSNFAATPNGAGGAAYARKNTLPMSAAEAATITVGAGGVGSSTLFVAGGDSYVTAASTTQVLAKGGQAGMFGGQASECTGDVSYDGGTGGTSGVFTESEEPFGSYTTWGGGGGAGGSLGPGGDGGDANSGGDGAAGAPGAGLYATPNFGQGGQGAGVGHKGRVVVAFTPS